MATTDKKNQHYIPKFYLRNFSFENNKKQIGIFDLNNGHIFERAALKAQGSKNFFYGADGILEDKLSTIEGDLAQIIKTIINDRWIPQKNTEEHMDLLLFVALTDLRNPVQIEGVKNMFKEAGQELSALDSSFDLNTSFPSISHEQALKLSFSSLANIVNIITDLDFKLLVNETKVPLISSDFPIIKYNQFLEQRKWSQPKTGYGLTGLQIFIPLSPTLVITFFDPHVYKVGGKRHKIFTITKEQDIDRLNLLQFINCFSTVFFNHSASKQYIRSLHEKSKKFKRANVPKASSSFLFKPGDNVDQILKGGQKNLILLNSTDCEINLQIEGIKIHSKGNRLKLTDRAAQLRRGVSQKMKQFYS